MTVPTKFAISKVYNNYYTNTSLYKNFFFTLFLILIISAIAILSIQLFNFTSDVTLKFEKIHLTTNIRDLPQVKLSTITGTNSVSSPPAQICNSKCTHWDCFNIYRCGHTGHDRIAVYVYPLKQYVDEDGVPATRQISKEFFSLLQAIVNSKYYTANPDEACLFIPSIDTLNQDNLRLNLTSKALNTLPL